MDRLLDGSEARAPKEPWIFATSSMAPADRESALKYSIGERWWRAPAPLLSSSAANSSIFRESGTRGDRGRNFWARDSDLRDRERV